MTMEIIDELLLDNVSEEARCSPRLRKNYNFHKSIEDKCQRFLNALEPGTYVPIHRHVSKDENFVLLKGKVRVSTFNDQGDIVDSYIISHDLRRYGVNIPKNVWHSLECIDSGSVIFEVKEGPYNPEEKVEVMEIY